MIRFAVAVLAALSLSANAAHAAGPPEPSAEETARDPLAEIRPMIKAERFSLAIPPLQEALAKDPRNADAWNYLGFALRKTGKLDESLTAYQKALAINDRHLGANEYLGELYVMKGDMAKAEAQLAKLKAICGTCEEYEDLAADIAKARK